MRLYWLSFCDPEKPQGSQFLGVCIVSAEDPALALLYTHQMGINPGGEVVAVPSPDNVDLHPFAKFMNRLLSRDQIDAMDLEIEAGQNQ